MSKAPVRPLPARKTVRTASGKTPSSSVRRTTRGAASRETLRPEAWIEAATEVLVDQGIDHVRVDVLAGELQVTRGSFYWHFRDREDLLRRVLQTWREGMTENLTRRLESAHPDPMRQLQDVISLPSRGQSAKRAARIELAIRAWARRDEMARHALDEADASRIDYTAQIFRALGFTKPDARHRAHIVYAYLIGESMMPEQDNAAQRAARAHLFHAIRVENSPHESMRVCDIPEWQYRESKS